MHQVPLRVFSSYSQPLLLTLLLGLLLTGCSSLPQDALSQKNEAGDLKAAYFDVDIYSFDGTKIKATIFQPALKAGEKAPVVIHTHGFSMFRMSGPLSIYSKLVLSGQAANKAWKSGYWVVSYDQRGHGNSEGNIQLMDPQHEIKDLSAIIDWIQNNISRIEYKKNDPVIGMVGESYGGETQLLGATLDHRIDAIVPLNTWNNLESSLYPNHVPKSGWLTLLILSGNIMSKGRMDPVLNKAYTNARKGFVPPEVFDYLEDHGFSYYCEKGQIPQVDVLMVQGFRDVLFPINEASKNFHCLKKAGNDVRFIGTQGGHLLPMSQFSVVPAYQVENTVHCGDKKIDLREAIVSWFDEKLKGEEGAASTIPQVCLTHDTKTGSVFSDIPIGGKTFTLHKANMKSGFAGFFEFPLRMIDRITSSFTKDDDKIFYTDLETTGGTLRPAFVPLTVAEESGTITGIPIVELTINNPNLEKNPTMFLSLGIKRKNSSKIKILSDQVMPFKGSGTIKAELGGVSSQLKKGDIIGLIIKSYSDQYRFSGSGWLTQAKIEGKIHLPIQENVSVNPGSHFASRQSLEGSIVNNE